MAGTIWIEALTGAAFEAWLKSVMAPRRVGQVAPLDPFGTSLRNLSSGSEFLATIEHGGSKPAAVEARRWDQWITDYGGLGVARKTASGAALTDTGAQVLEGWRRWGVVNDQLGDELPRMVWLVEWASRSGLRWFETCSGNWRRLRDRHSASALFEAPVLLALSTYMDREHAGFNPWRVIFTVTEELDLAVDWDGLRSSFGGRVDDEVGKLERLIMDGVPRFRPRRTFCQALELHRLAQVGSAQFFDALTTWKVSYA